MFLANENFPRPSILLLRKSEVAVRSIQEELPGIADEQVLQLAKENDYIILTFDRDYGELIFRYVTEHPPAVVYFREKGQDPMFAGQTLLSLMQTNSIHFENAFTVIEKENVRQRFYSKGTRT
jgi:predicted nuclease of predicted toxin-antitoxin system